MCDHNLESLADSIQCVAQLTVPLGKYATAVYNDTDTLMRERNHWIADQKRHGSRGGMEQHGSERLGSLREQLKSLEVVVQEQVTDIKRLESSIRKNEKILNG